MMTRTDTHTPQSVVCTRIRHQAYGEFQKVPDAANAISASEVATIGSSSFMIAESPTQLPSPRCRASRCATTRVRAS